MFFENQNYSLKYFISKLWLAKQEGYTVWKTCNFDRIDITIFGVCLKDAC